jgi:hypothetical protein
MLGAASSKSYAVLLYSSMPSCKTSLLVAQYTLSTAGHGMQPLMRAGTTGTTALRTVCAMPSQVFNAKATTDAADNNDCKDNVLHHTIRIYGEASRS